MDFSTQADAATQTFRARVSIAPPEGITILPGYDRQDPGWWKPSRAVKAWLFRSLLLRQSLMAVHLSWIIGDDKKVSKQAVKGRSDQ